MEYPTVPEKLRQFMDAGYAVGVITNQSTLESKKITLQQLKTKVEKVCTLLKCEPFFLIAGYHDVFRKPLRGSFQYLQGIVSVPLTAENCFFCGDMVGRECTELSSHSRKQLEKHQRCQFRAQLPHSGIRSRCPLQIHTAAPSDVDSVPQASL